MSTSPRPRALTRSTGLAAVAAATCSAALFAAPGTSAQAVPGLVGRTFVSTSVAPTPIPGGGKLEIGFGAKDRVGLSAGCNRMMGFATARGDRLVFSRLASTMMACPPPRDRADEWAENFTGQAPTYRLAGPVLTLSTKSTTVVLREEAAPQHPR